MAHHTVRDLAHQLKMAFQGRTSIKLGALTAKDLGRLLEELRK